MSTAATGPTPYRVVYSGQVQQRIRALARIARQRGDGEAYLAALKEFHRRLCLYPQFGEPLKDLLNEPGQLWVGAVRPLSMRYGVYDERRLVIVAEIPILLPKAKDQSDD